MVENEKAKIEEYVVYVCVCLCAMFIEHEVNKMQLNDKMINIYYSRVDRDN